MAVLNPLKVILTGRPSEITKTTALGNIIILIFLTPFL